jgi:hypothetical protein
LRREAVGELQFGSWTAACRGRRRQVLARLRAAAHKGRWHGGGRRVPAQLWSDGAWRETAAGELQLNSGGGGTQMESGTAKGGG